MDAHLWLRHSFANRLQTLSLLLFLAAYLALLGWLLWGPGGLLWLLLIGAFFVLFSPTASPQLIMRLYRARPLARAEAPGLYRMLAELAQRAGLENLPTLYYLPSTMVNAFAVGTQRRAAIAVTDGLILTLHGQELYGVLAHEISHIRNNDIRVMSLADMAGRLTKALSTVGLVLLLINLPLVLLSEARVNWLGVLLLLLAPQLSVLAQLGLSRVREYNADLNAAALTGDPEGLARALIKLERLQKPFWQQLLLPGYRVPEPSLLRSHPATEERVRRLLQVARNRSAPSTGAPSAGDYHPFRVGGEPHRRSPRWHWSGLWH